jgi:hypothetical protein
VPIRRGLLPEYAALQRLPGRSYQGWRYCVGRLVDQGLICEDLCPSRYLANAARGLRPMRGLSTEGTAQVVVAGHAFMQSLRRGHYELGLEVPPGMRVAAAFVELARAI